MTDVAKEGEVVVITTAPSLPPIVLQYKTFEQVIDDVWTVRVKPKMTGVLSLGVWPLHFYQKSQDEHEYDHLSFGIPSQSLQHLPVTGSDDLGLIEWWGDESNTHDALIRCMDWLIDKELRM
jgi:hypothetical protein